MFSLYHCKLAAQKAAPLCESMIHVYALFTGALDYPVTVTVKESLLLSKKVFLKWYSSSPSNTNWLRSFNPGWWWVPMWMKYKGTSPIKYVIMAYFILFS